MRVALLVDPYDEDGVREAIGIATSFWGGALFPLVPVMRRRPRWWPSWGDGQGPSASEITLGYLETYDADWVLPVRGTATPVSDDRLAEIRDGMIYGSGAAPSGARLELLLAHLYETRFRFAERTPPDHLVHGGPSLLGDVLLGRASPKDIDGSRLMEWLDRLGSREIDLDPEVAIRSQVEVAGRSSVITPLSLGIEGFRFSSRTARWTYLYFCSKDRTWDALDLWNLRAAGVEVIACVVEWLDDFAPVFDALLDLKNVQLVGAPALTKDEVASIREVIADRPLLPAPVYWARWPQRWSKPARVVVTSDEAECSVVDERFEVPPLDPEWAARPSETFVGAWINEYRIHADGLGGEVAEVLPHDLAEPQPVIDRVRRSVLRQTRLREGRIVVQCGTLGRPATFELPTGAEVVRAWLMERGLEARVSDPGRTLLEMVRRLRGTAYADLTLTPSVVRLLEEGTRKHHLASQHVVRVLRDGARRSPERLLGELTDFNVLRSGALLECPRCRQTNCVEPELLDERMRCERCLEPFSFPHDRPPRRWGYRPIGPFAVPKYADGAYTALLACGALIERARCVGTWAPSLNVDGFGEVDFVVWREPRFGHFNSLEPELILGEAKSFDLFQEVDADRLVSLKEHLGQGVLCFATLRSELADSERVLLADVMQRLGGDRRVAPLLILTQHELFARDIGMLLEQHAGAIRGHAVASSAEHLATVTQKLYVG